MDHSLRRYRTPCHYIAGHHSILDYVKVYICKRFIGQKAEGALANCFLLLSHSKKNAHLEGGFLLNKSTSICDHRRTPRGACLGY